MRLLQGLTYAISIQIRMWEELETNKYGGSTCIDLSRLKDVKSAADNPIIKRQ